VQKLKKPKRVMMLVKGEFILRLMTLPKKAWYIVC
jgi:hypothetical protein